MKTQLFFALVILGTSIFSQESTKQIKKANQLWGGYYSNIILNEKWAVNSDLQFRTKDWHEHNSQALVRTGIARKFSEKLYITVGLAHFRFYITDVATRGEWRPWQELGLTEKYNKLKVSYRFRIEQRFNESLKDGKPSSSYVFNWRFRYKIDLQLPLLSKNNKAIYLTLGNEILLNAGKKIGFNYFDQNRLSAGINIELTKNFGLQPQFIYVWQQQSNGSLDKISVIRLNLLHKIKL